MYVKIERVEGGNPPTTRKIYVHVSHNSGLTWGTYFHFQDESEVDAWLATLESAEVVEVWPCDVPGYYDISTDPAL